MQKSTVFLVSVLILIGGFVNAQSYHIVIKGGHLIDPKNNINELMDVAILDGKIVKVAKDIDGKQARQVVNAIGYFITPKFLPTFVNAAMALSK
jgi:dihydroorotase